MLRIWLFAFLFSIGAIASAHAANALYDPFHLMNSNYAAAKADYELRFDGTTSVDNSFALFEPSEIVKFKNKIILSKVLTVETDKQKENLRKLLGNNPSMEPSVIPYFKFALSVATILTPVPYSVELALATVDLVSSIPSDIEKTRGNLDTLIGKGGKIYLTETIQTTPVPWTYTKILTYQIQVGTELRQVVLGMLRVRIEAP